MVRQEIIRDSNYNVIEEYDNCGNHIKYNNNGDIIYYKIDNFEYPSFKSIQSPQEQEFVDIVKDGIIRINEIKYPNYIFLFKNDKFLFEYNSNNKTIFFDYNLVWSVIQKKHSMEYVDRQKFLINTMEKHFNCKNIIPLSTVLLI